MADLKLEINPPKVTIVSTLPYVLREEKPGMFPGIYELEPAPEKGKIGITHIGNGYYLEMVPYGDHRTPPRKVDITAERIAEGLIFDYSIALIGTRFDPDNEGIIRKPGLFWVDGVFTTNEIIVKYDKDVQKAQKETAAWFLSLVSLADDDWQKYKQHKMISDVQRIAARHLGLKREWAVDAVWLVNNTCPACQENYLPGAAICRNCKTIVDMDKYKELVKSGVIPGQVAVTK